MPHTSQGSAGGGASPAHIIVTVDGVLPSGLRLVTCRLDDSYPDGAVVAKPHADAQVLMRTAVSRQGILRVDFADFATPGAPPTWFVHVDEPQSAPRATNLVAFVGDRFPAGTIIDGRQFATLGIRSESQVAAIRWYPRGGLVHQVFVAPQWRRHQLAIHIIYAAEALHRAQGWPGWIHGDGRRTELGQKLMSGMRHPQRWAPLTEVMPSMDAPAPSEDG
jgi:hypothetical protein